jgi:tartrate dehydrogenase/decarboxylase/D-malate dehydrogenase
MAKTHRIAVVPGDGIGKETVPEALKVLDAAARRFGFGLEFAHYDWSCETYKKTGAMMPADGSERSAGPTCPTISRCGACSSRSAAASTST